MLDGVSTSTILVIVAIALIVLVWQITTNAVLLNAMQTADPNGFVDGVRGLPIVNLVLYSVALVTLIGGTGYLLFKRGGVEKIESGFGKVEQQAQDFLTMKQASATGDSKPGQNTFGGPDALVS